MTFEKPIVIIRRYILKHNVALARIIRKGNNTTTHVVDLNKQFTELKNDENRNYANTDEITIYREGFIPVVYYNENFSNPVIIGKASGESSRMLAVLHKNEKSILKAQFWAKADWLTGKPAQIGGILILALAGGAAYFGLTGSEYASECVDLIKGHLEATSSTAPNIPKV